MSTTSLEQFLTPSKLIMNHLTGICRVSGGKTEIIEPENAKKLRTEIEKTRTMYIENQADLTNDQARRLSVYVDSIQDILNDVSHSTS